MWLNIDERTYRERWKEPFIIPRDELLELMKFAVEGQAAVIIIDVDLSREIPTGDKELSEEDQQLKNYFHDYAAKPDSQPPIILVRTLRQPLDSEANKYPEPRPSFLDKEVKQSREIHWATPMFWVEKDGMIRRWQLWEATCKGQQGEVVPSIQLLTKALIKESPNGPQKLANKLAHFTPHCDFPPSASEQPESADLRRRILYRMPWKLKEGESRPAVPFYGNVKVPLLEAIPAYNILKLIDQPRPLGKELIKNRIVVIGGSFAEARDIHITPLGEMPGPLIIINAIHSLLHYGEIEPPPWWVKLSVVAALIVIMAIAFTLFRSFWGRIVSSAAIIVFLLPLSFWLFKSGVWLDFSIPLVAVQLMQMHAEFQESRYSPEVGNHEDT